MSDVVVKRIEDFDSPNGGGFCRARASLGVTARVGPSVTRKITTADEPVQLLAIGAMPGRPYSAPAFTEEGAPLPG